MAKAAILLAMARKCRDADHLTNLVYDQKNISDVDIEAAITEARNQPEEIPDYAYDVHTFVGKRQGKTKKDFFRDEFAALTPRQTGLFDELVKSL